MTDSEKLTAFAKEVLAMRKWQHNYFKISALQRKGQETKEEVQRALRIAIDHENRVDALAAKCLNRQTELPIS